MYNPGIDRRNRKLRRLAAKYSGDMKDGWQAMKHLYQPINMPIDLGIKSYKKVHRNDSKRVLYFKQEMWKAFYELKKEK
jgi:hypothetical protein